MKAIECPRPELTLNANERQCLELLAARHTAAAELRQRARIVLECARGMSHTAVAESEDVTEATVGKWHARFVRNRVAGLDGEPELGARPSDQAIEQ